MYNWQKEGKYLQEKTIIIKLRMNSGALRASHCNNSLTSSVLMNECDWQVCCEKGIFPSVPQKSECF